MNTLRYIFSPKIVAALCGVLTLGLLGFNLATATAAHAQLPQDCDTATFHNSIISCGFQNKNEFKAAYDANKQGDLHSLYADGNFNFKASDMSRFMSSAVWATAYKDGRIVLDDGRVVATNAWSLGREKFNDQRQAITLGGHVYYWSFTKYSFASNSIRALVLMDTQNKYMQFAVLTSCGNPISGNKPTFQCDMLQKSKKSNTDYEFWTDATAKGGASIKNVHYDFGDNTNANSSSATAHVPHHYAKPGNYHVTVTVTYNVNGHDQTETVQTHCQTDITVQEEQKPVFTCDSLTRVLINGTRNKYTFTLRGSSNQAAVKTATFNFGDNQTATVNAKSVNGKDEATADHEYAKDGTYKITGTFTYDKGTTPVTLQCTVSITITPQTCADTPTKPECQPPCVVNPKAPECNKIPDTGPAEIVGSTLGLSSVAGLGMYYRASRRNWIAKALNRR